MEYVKKIASYFMKRLPGTKALKPALYASGNMQEMREILIKIFGETES